MNNYNNKYNNYLSELPDPKRDDRVKLADTIGPLLAKSFSDMYIFPDELFRKIIIAKERFNPMTWETIYIEDNGFNFNYYGKNPDIKAFVEEYKLQNIKDVSLLEDKVPSGVLNKIASFISGKKGNIKTQIEKTKENLKQAGGKRKTRNRKNMKKRKMSKKNHKC